MTVAGTLAALAVVGVAVGCAGALVLGFAVTLGFTLGMSSSALLLVALDRCLPMQRHESTQIPTIVERPGGSR